MNSDTVLNLVFEDLRVFESVEPIVTQRKLDRIASHMFSKIDSAAGFIASAVAGDDSCCDELDVLSACDLFNATMEAAEDISSLIRFINRIDNKNFDVLKIVSHKAQASIKMAQMRAKHVMELSFPGMQDDNEMIYFFGIMFEDATKAIKLCERCENEVRNIVERMSKLIESVEEHHRFHGAAA